MLKNLEKRYIKAKHYYKKLSISYLLEDKEGKNKNIPSIPSIPE